MKEVARGSERSSLFWWLVEHHDEIAAEAGGKRMRWEPLCARFAAHGLRDVNGRPPSPRTARETWLQARRTVAQARERKRQADADVRPGQKFPSRISPAWRPQIVPPAGPVGASSSALVSLGSSAVVPAITAGPPGADAPMVFDAVGPDGEALPEGKVFYQGKVMSLHAAKELEGLFRKMRTEDWWRARTGGD